MEISPGGPTAAAGGEATGAIAGGEVVGEFVTVYWSEQTGGGEKGKKGISKGGIRMSNRI